MTTISTKFLLKESVETTREIRLDLMVIMGNIMVSVGLNWSCISLVVGCSLANKTLLILLGKDPKHTT